MKCKVCSTKVPRGILERVCPECGWRTPPIHMLLISAAAPTAICVYLLTRYFNGEEFYSGIHTLYLILIFGAIAVFGWTNYEVVRKRRKGLGYDA